MAGDEGAKPLVMLHAGPGSSRGLEPLINELARTRSVFAFDTLGHGGSDPPAVAEPDIGLYSESVNEALEGLDVGQVDVLGTHTGALIAIELCLRHPERVGRLVLDGVPLFTPDERDDLLANYIPVLASVDDGSHLVKLWHMLRDMTLFWPWYRHTTEGIRPFEPPDAEGLHRRMIDTVPALTTYHLAYAAAFRYPTRDRLPEMRRPSLMCAGPSDPLLPTLEECGRLTPQAITLQTPGGTNDRGALHRTASTYEKFLAGSDPSNA
jgi:pimeloyl-ACP methyl ester carboxylesterase